MSDGLRTENEDLQKVINGLEDEGAATKADLQQLTAQQEKSVAEITELTKQLDDLIESSTNDKAMLQADNDGKASDIAAQQEEIESLKASIEKSDAQYVENITAARNELDEKLANQIARAATAEEEFTKVTTQAEALKSRLEAELAEAVVQQKQAAEVQAATDADLAQVKNELQLSQETVDKRDSAIEDLNAKINVLQVENLEVQKQAKVVQEELGGFKEGAGSDINVLKLEIEKQKQIVERRDTELATAKSEFDTMRESDNARSQEVSAQNVVIERLTAERDALTLQVETLKEEYQAEIQKVTTNFQEEREVASTRFKSSITQMEETMASAEESNLQLTVEMTEQRKRIEERNEALQTELTQQANQYKDVSEQIVDVKIDLSKAQLTLSQNAGQFKQLANELRLAGQLNTSLKAQLDAQKVDWDADKEVASSKQADMEAKIEAVENQVTKEQAKVLAAREDVVNIASAAETSRADAKASKDRTEVLEQTVAQMEEAAVAAEALREQLRQQHQSDLENGAEERELLAKKVADLTADSNALQLKLDQTRQELVEARQKFSEETILREARDAEIANGKKREEQMDETLKAKDEALAASQADALAGERRSAEELADSQAKVEQLQEQIAGIKKELEQATLDISTWKSTAEDNATQRDEFSALADANASRAGEAETLAESAAAELAKAQADRQSEVAAKEEEKLTLVAKDEALMQDMNQVRTQMEQEATAKQASVNAQTAAEQKLSETEALLAELQGSRTELEGKYTEQSSELAELKSLLSKTEQEANANQSNFDAQSARFQEEAMDATTKQQEALDAKMAAEKNAADADAARQAAEDSLAEATRVRDEGSASLQQTQDELTAKLEEAAQMTTATGEKQNELEANIERLEKEAAGLTFSLDKAEASLSKAQEDVQVATTAKEEADAARKELEGWKADALVQQDADRQHLDDTVAKLATEIQTIKAEEANHKAEKELADNRNQEAQAAKEAAEAAAAAAIEAKKKSAEEMRIAAADADAKAAKLSDKERQLVSSNEAATNATAAQTEANDQARSLAEEVGLLKKQASEAARQAETATGDKEKAEARIQSMDAMAVQNNQLLQELRSAYKQTLDVKNQQKDTIAKLLDLATSKEVEAKAAKDAIADGKAPEPVLSQLREEAGTLNSAVQAAAKAFDAQSGLFEAADIRKIAGALSSMPDADLTAEASALVAGGKLSSGAPAGAKSGGKGGGGGGGGGGGKGGSSGGGGGGGAGYAALEGTLEKGSGGKKKASYKKRYFKLGDSSLTYSSSAKPDAKVLGIIQLSGGKVKQKDLDIVVTDGSGRENGACIV